MKRKAVTVIALFLCAGVGLATLFISLEAGSRKQLSRSPQCSMRIHVKIGEAIFNFPNRETLRYLKHRDQVISISDILCQDSPTEATSALLFVHPSQTHDEALKKYRGFVTIGIGVPASVDTYQAAVKDGRLAGVEIEKLPVRDGFYVHHYQAKAFLLIPTDRSFTTPSGNPVVFFCAPYASMDGQPNHCGTNIQWRQNIGLGIGYISDQWIARSELRSFYNSLLSYMQSMLSNPK